MPGFRFWRAGALPFPSGRAGTGPATGASKEGGCDGFGRVGSLIGNREALIERCGERFEFPATLDGGAEGRL